MQRILLIPVVSITLIMILTGTTQIRAFGVEGTSTQTSCVNNQPCQTVVCSKGQPCRVSETPNTDFDYDETDSLSQPLEGTGTGTLGMTPFSDPYNNMYTEDQEEYREDRQDMMEDAEYE